MLHAFVGTVAQLHGSGVCLGDINLNNFLYDRASEHDDVDRLRQLIKSDAMPVAVCCSVGALDMILPNTTTEPRDVYADGRE